MGIFVDPRIHCRENYPATGYCYELVFFGREPEKMVNNGCTNKNHPSVRREGHFVLFRQRFKYRPVSPGSCNAAVFLPEKSGAFSNTYVSSSP